MAAGVLLSTFQHVSFTHVAKPLFIWGSIAEIIFFSFPMNALFTFTQLHTSHTCKLPSTTAVYSDGQMRSFIKQMRALVVRQRQMLLFHSPPPRFILPVWGLNLPITSPSPGQLPFIHSFIHSLPMC